MYLWAGNKHEQYSMLFSSHSDLGVKEMLLVWLLIGSQMTVIVFHFHPGYSCLKNKWETLKNVAAALFIFLSISPVHCQMISVFACVIRGEYFYRGKGSIESCLYAL